MKYKLRPELKSRWKLLTKLRLKEYLDKAELIKFWRNNPCIACKDLLGIELLDYQKYILMKSWNTQSCAWCCSRNAGKSFIGAIFVILKAVLYPNQSIYIIAPVGGQSKETYAKMEQIVLNNGQVAISCPSLNELTRDEIVINKAGHTGFGHDAMGYRVEFVNGSFITTLNGAYDNNRGKRSNLVFFDEVGFAGDELVTIVEAFRTQNSDFVMSTDLNFDLDSEFKTVPNQFIYASSASSTDTIFYSTYRDYALKMIAGDSNYFCCDITCDIPLNPTKDNEPYSPLFSRTVVDSLMAKNPELAKREFYNKFQKDGGDQQIIKMGTIKRNETFYLPVLSNRKNKKYIFAFDPARTMDNSILLIGEIEEDENDGMILNIVNCINFRDVATKGRFNLTSVEQRNIILEQILLYNGDTVDYENILGLAIDTGAGGGGISAYADNLLLEWYDKHGKRHKGIIDEEYPLYMHKLSEYRNHTRNIGKYLDPRKFKTIMTEETLELLSLDLIRFPKEYTKDDIYIEVEDSSNNGETTIVHTKLSFEEKEALINIDLLKTECINIYRYENQQKTTRNYALSIEKERKMNDDRFYSLIMLGHLLYELRRNKTNERKKIKINPRTMRVKKYSAAY